MINCHYVEEATPANPTNVPKWRKFSSGAERKISSSFPYMQDPMRRRPISRIKFFSFGSLVNFLKPQLLLESNETMAKAISLSFVWSLLLSISHSTAQLARYVYEATEAAASLASRRFVLSLDWLWPKSLMNWDCLPRLRSQSPIPLWRDNLLLYDEKWPTKMTHSELLSFCVSAITCSAWLQNAK